MTQIELDALHTIVHNLPAIAQALDKIATSLKIANNQGGEESDEY